MRKPKNRHIIILAIITALCLLGDSMLYIVLPVYYKEMGLNSLWEVGVILSVNRLVRLPLNPCIGWFYQHISERTGILIAVALAVFTTLSYGFISGFIGWIIVRCLWGLAWTLLRLGALFAILHVSTVKNRGHLTGLYNGLYRLGSLVGMLLGGILADQIGLQYTVLLFSLITAGAFILGYLRLPAGSTDHQISSTTLSMIDTLALIFKHSQVLWIMLTGAIVALVTQGVLASTLSYLIEVHIENGLNIWDIVIGAATLGGFFQALRWGWEPWLAPWFGRLSDRRFSRASVLACAFGVGGLCMLMLSIRLPLAPWFICLVLIQLVSTALTTVSEAAATDSASVLGGRTLLMSFALVVDMGAAIGPLVAYFINALWDIDAAYTVCAILMAILCIRWSLYSISTRKQY